MNRHPFRWEGLVFGLLFLAVAAGWAVWEQDLLTRRELSLALSGVLVVLGVVGVVATFVKPRPAPDRSPSLETPDLTEENHDQAAHPQH